MIGAWGTPAPAPKPEETPEEKEARRKARAEERAKRPVDKSRMTKEQLEKYEEREKRREEKNVRTAKMDEWALGDDAKPSDQVFKSNSQFGKFFKVHNAK